MRLAARRLPVSGVSGEHSWGTADTHRRQACVTCGVWRMTVRLDLVYYSRDPRLTATWSVMRPPCRPAVARVET